MQDGGAGLHPSILPLQTGFTTRSSMKPSLQVTLATEPEISSLDRATFPLSGGVSSVQAKGVMKGRRGVC